MDSSELRFTEICRCCKGTESGMTSIFDGKEHSIYPPIKEMLKSITSLNMQENDGFPSLVCTLCLMKIQDAFTFILQVIHIDEELSQMLSRRKQADTLPQGESECISAETIKTETETENQSAPVQSSAFFLEIIDDTLDVDGNHSLPQDDFDHPTSESNVDMNESNSLSVNVDNDSTTNDNDLANLDQDLDAADESVDAVDETCPFLTLHDLEDPEKMRKYYTYTVNDNEAISYVEDSGVDTLYQHLEAKSSNKDEAANTEEKEKICPKSGTNLEKTILSLNVAHAFVLKCTLCSSTSVNMHALKRHLKTHCMDKPFACSKCNQAFGRKDKMQRHWRICTGDNTKYARHKKEKQVLALTLQDLEDPVKLEKYYTMTEIDVQVQNDGDDVSVEVCSKSETNRRKTTSTLPHGFVLKCIVCASTSTSMHALKRHLKTHCKDKPFACAKCNQAFGRKDKMLRHWRNCNGKNFACDVCNHGCRTEKLLQKHLAANHADDEGEGEVPQISLTLQDLRDPKQMKKYYTEICPTLRTTRSSSVADPLAAFKCKLCVYTCVKMNDLKRHLYTHCTDKPFPCSKCNHSFGRRDIMLRHWLKCKGEMNQSARPKGNASKPVVGLTHQDLDDPETITFYCTVHKNTDEIKTQGGEVKHDEEPEEINHSTRATHEHHVFKCSLCGNTSRKMSDLKRHLHTHCNDKPFACSKCSQKFVRRDKMVRHLRTCNGVDKITCDICNRRHNFRNEEELQVHNQKFHEGEVSKPVISLTLQDLEDPESMKKYYTTVPVSELLNNDDVERIKRTTGETEDDADIEENRSKLRPKRRKTTSTRTEF